MLQNKASNKIRNTSYSVPSPLLWILQSTQASIRSASCVKTPYNWLTKNHRLMAKSAKPPNGFKRFAVNMNKTTDCNKLFERRRMWVKKQILSKVGREEGNKSEKMYMRRKDIDAEKFSVDIADDNIKQRPHEHRTQLADSKKERETYMYRVRPFNTFCLLDIKLEDSKTTKNESGIENEEKLLGGGEGTETMSQTDTLSAHIRAEFNYKICEEIGKGSYAVVKKAIHTPSGTPVAIKIYGKMVLSHSQRRARLRQEILIMRKLKHQGIVKLYDCFQSADELYVVMELIEGQTLRKYLSLMPDKKLSEEKAISILKEIAVALNYCHLNEVLHRDIKLDNILMDKKGKIKLIDFGFSVIEKGNGKLTTHCGSLSYMSPELVNKEEYFGKPADMWALGVVFYICLLYTSDAADE
eukprot:TRINITY_DN9255_c0_g1_i13.p1 TRINITY_DN9255_c0_g1~~TRINITY_DN9255_c0_g1_i13.p1  ORF type:complete len:412 (-),score=67.04 TRINITY_DN9255_c0_g1_i13:59-1294(-)